jgi:hypothetical protein
MKKEFSFYEFVGILVPGVTLLFFAELIIETVYAKVILDFSKIGESFIFLIIAYGIGHVLQAVGNVFELIFWKVFGGMPTQWLTKANRFNYKLFDTEQTEIIKQKAYAQFGKKSDKDYGMEIYCWLSLKEKITEKRIDVFNANYSLFRGLSVTFYILSAIILKYLGWRIMFVPLTVAALSNYRMFRFAKLYAKEVYRSYLYCL